jgi:cell division protein FtsN
MVDKKTLQTNESNILPIKEVVQELIPDSAASTVQMIRPEEIARQQETAPSVDAAPAPFAIIVGAFRLEENAEKLVGELQAKGLNSVVYDRSKTGLYRVALATFRQKEEAVQLLASVQAAEFPGAWLLHK